MRFIRDIIAEQRNASPEPDGPAPDALDDAAGEEAQPAPRARDDGAFPEEARHQEDADEWGTDTPPVQREDLVEEEASGIEAAIAAELAGLSTQPATSEPGAAALDREAHPDEQPTTRAEDAKSPAARGVQAHPTVSRGTDPAPQAQTPCPAAAHEKQQVPPSPAEAVTTPLSAHSPASETKPTTDTPAEPQLAASVDVPQPAAGRSAKRSGRVRTRLLGFGGPQDSAPDPFKAPDAPNKPADPVFPVGWLVVVDGPGRGASFTIQDGVAHIGRNADQAVALTFGDTSVSRENHAAIAYDDEQRSFFLGHGGKANLVRLNGKPVLSTEALQSEDLIRIGETTLRFVAFCGGKFSWSQSQARGGRDVAAE